MLSNKAKFERRKNRIRTRIKKQSSLPRLCVFKSNQHIHVQVIDDLKGVTIASASTLQKDFNKLKNKSNIQAAKEIGIKIATDATNKGIKKVVFDKGGYQYHGVVKAIANTARETGLEL